MLRGSDQRNEAFRWIRENLNVERMNNSIIYCGDDDNRYDHRLFDVLRTVNRVGVLPVGLVGPTGLGSEGPIVLKEMLPSGKENLKVVGWRSGWPGTPVRKFQIDMAGFAFCAAELFINPDLIFNCTNPGFAEETFLNLFVNSLEELEVLTENVLVFHTKTCFIHEDSYTPEWRVPHLDNLPTPSNEPTE
eukprot:TRINITY_DN12806_c0_g1_i1.p1 TRINITY_DN12806_c0_g1~~TRINITY_DN12806_c0_g1_i1.p1  ORF type:complete len:190 (+),score=30.02 TRINITY_DN12806_c0_g1_i1:330-899(+)